MKRVGRLALTVVLAGLTLGTAGCGRRPLTPPQDLGKLPSAPYLPPADPGIALPAPAIPNDPYLPPVDPDPQLPEPATPPVEPDEPTDPGDPADPGQPTEPQQPSEPAPPPPTQQPASDIEFWTMVAKMGFAAPQDEIRRQIVEITQRTPATWSKGREGDVGQRIAKKFAENQKYFVDPPSTVDEYSQRSLAFAARQDANTSYYLDLRYSVKSKRMVVLKSDQMTFEVLGSNASNQITWYSQWKGSLKLPGYLFIPATVYNPSAGGDVGAMRLRGYR